MPVRAACGPGSDVLVEAGEAVVEPASSSAAGAASAVTVSFDSGKVADRLAVETVCLPGPETVSRVVTEEAAIVSEVGVMDSEEAG